MRKYRLSLINLLLFCRQTTIRGIDMKQIERLRILTVILGFLAAFSFICKLGMDLIHFEPHHLWMLFGFDETSGSLSSLLNHIFIILTFAFSGALFFYCKSAGKEEFREAATLYFVAYGMLFVRTFLLPLNQYSFGYVLSAGFQILLTLMSMFFFLISFINSKTHFIFAVLTAIDMMIYFTSVLYSMLLTDFTLPNLGSIIAAVINITFMSIFVWIQKNDPATQ